MAASVNTTSHEDVKVKVVLIDTHYVETNPQSFKSIVQSLTGKDCCVSWIQESSFSCRKTETKNIAAKVEAEGSYGTATIGSDFDYVLKGLSFKDLERLILEAPPLEELSCLWAETLSS